MQQPRLWGFAAIVAGTPSPLSSILAVDPEVGCVATEAGLSFHGNAGHILLDVNVQGLPSLVCVNVCSHMCICTHPCMCMFEVCSWSVNNIIPHLQTWSITVSPGMLNLRGVPECPWVGREEEIQEKVSSTHFSSLSLLAWLTDL